MKGIRWQLAQPVELTCRHVAAALLMDAGKACDRLGVPDDSEALHDFRVSVRRLRSFIGAYKRHFPKAVSNRIRKQLRKLIAMTNAGRDQEVHARWIEAELAKRSLSKTCRHGFLLVLSELSPDHPESDTELAESTRAAFHKVKAKLEKRLSEPRQAIRVDANGDVVTFSEATGGIILGRSHELRAGLALVHSTDDRQEAHRARLSGKRLRYVLEQVRSVGTGGRAATTKLKELQDILGDLRDLQNLEQRIDRLMESAAVGWSHRVADAARGEGNLAEITRGKEGLDDCRALGAALVRIRKEEMRLFRKLERRWLISSSSVFFDRMTRIAQQLWPDVPLSGETTEGGDVAVDSSTVAGEESSLQESPAPSSSSTDY
jgi:CHAD domain-containing protein